MDEIIQLKARAYDMITLIEQAQSELRQINIKIAEAVKKQEEARQVQWQS